MKVLIVDDTPENVYMLETLLKGNSYTVSTAANGKEALDKLRQEPATLIISDILMPKMDGFQLCRAVKADDALKNIPFIFYTATYTNEKDRDFALSLGASRFILKPTDPGEFINIIKEVLDEGEKGRLPIGETSIEKETEYLKEHQARLVNKLEDKISQLEQSEERYRSLIACAGDAIVTIDAQGGIISWNETAEHIFGYESDEVLGKSFSLLVPEELRAEQDSLIARVKERKLIGFLETVRKTKAGALIPVGISLSLMKDKQGRELGISAIIRDVSKRKLAEETLREGEARLRTLLQTIPDLVWLKDANGVYLSCNPMFERFFGAREADIVGKTDYDFVDRELADFFREHDRKAMAAGKPSNNEEWITFADDGHRALLDTIKTPVYDAVGNVTGVLGIARDITERKQVEEKLRASEAELQKAQKVANVGNWIWHIKTGRLEWSDQMYRIFGIDQNVFTGDLAEVIARAIHPDDRAAVERVNLAVIRDKKTIPLEYRVIWPDGTVRVVWAEAGELAVNEQGDPVVLTGIVQDITDRKQAELELAASEAKFRKLYQEFHGLLDAVPDSLMLLDKDLKVLWANRVASDFIGADPEALTGHYCHALWYKRTTPCEPCPVRESFSTERPVSMTVTRPDGRTFDIRTVPLRGERGGIARVIEVVREITEHRKLEAQYLHAQKMESIGTLAGGIAHDFNNILSAIIGYGHVTLMTMAEDDPQRHNIESMLEAADRATYLTKSLLLFSRKQITERKSADLNEMVRKVEKFLKRVIGEDIECKTMLSDNPIPILADGHQLEQVLMNLAINARDAMPGGGAFTIKTEQIDLTEDFTRVHGYGKPGPYAMITISDTGMGMDEATQKRIFEPFFTTKEVGKGTGLGLAVVYGIIKDHDGFINLYSEPGKGTTFRIYLPIIRAVVAEETTAPNKEAPARGTETVLVAEDDANLRKLSRTVLTEFGYTVIEAVDGEDAVKKFMENKDTIQLLLFDLIMPKMNGKEASDVIRKIKPDMKVLFASGYDPDLVQQKKLLEAGVNLVYKPISPMELLRKVRSVLDGVTQ